MPNYSVWITNTFTKSFGHIGVKIFRDGATIDDFINASIPDNDIAVLDQNQRALLRIGKLKKVLNRDTGQMESNSIELEFLDRWDYSATLMDSTLVSEDLDASDKTLLSHIFDDLDATYQIQCFRLPLGLTPLTATLSDYEYFFVGRIDPKTITESGDNIHQAQTANERKVGQKKVTVYSLVDELKSKTVADFNAAVSSGDMSGNKRFFNGFSSFRPLEELYVNSAGELDIGAVDDSINNIATKPYHWYSKLEIAGHGLNTIDKTKEIAYGSSFPLGKWGMNLLQVFTVIAEVCKLRPFGTSHFIPALFPIQNIWLDATSGYAALGDGSDDKLNIHIYYNYVFGVSPKDGSSFDSPISFKQTTTLSEVLRSFATDFGCYVWPIIDTQGRPGFRIIRRDYNFGNIPSHWTSDRVLSHSVETIDNPKAGVIVKNKGNDGGVKVIAANKGEYITVESTLRAGLFGGLESVSIDPVYFTGKYLEHNAELKGYENQSVPNVRYDDNNEENRLNKEAWIHGANYYSLHTVSGTNVAYPPTLEQIENVLGNGTPGSETWDGFYRLAGLHFETGAAANRHNTTFGLAQFLAKELCGYKRKIKRRYGGIVGDDNTLTYIQPGLRASWFHDGAIREFRVIETEQDFETEQCECAYIEEIDHSVDLPYEILQKDSKGGSGNGGTSTSGDGGLVDTGNTTTIINSPVIVARAVAMTKGDLHTYTEASLQLVIYDPDTTKNGLWIVSSAGTKTRPTIPHKYGMQVLCVDSWPGGIFGINTYWQLISIFFGPNYGTEVIVLDGATGFQVWRKLAYYENVDQRLVTFDLQIRNGIIGSPLPGYVWTSNDVDGIGYWSDVNDLVNFPCNLAVKFVKTGFNFTFSGGFTFDNVAIDVDVFCIPPNSSSTQVVSTNPFRLQPSKAGIYRLSAHFACTLPALFADYLELWSYYFDGTFATVRQIDSRYFDVVILPGQTTAFITGAELLEIITPNNDQIGIQLVKVGAGPALCTFCDVRIDIEDTNDCPDCTPP